MKTYVRQYWLLSTPFVKRHDMVMYPEHKQDCSEVGLSPEMKELRLSG